MKIVIEEKITSEMIGTKFEPCTGPWRKGDLERISVDEYNDIKSVVNGSMIKNNFFPTKPITTHHQHISLLFNLRNSDKTKINIVKLMIQKTDKFCVHLIEYSGKKSYPEGKNSNIFLYELTFDELKDLLSTLIKNINSYL